MKGGFMKLFPLLVAGTLLSACAMKKDDQKEMVDKKTVGTLPTEKEPVLEKIAEFRGLQVTGVTVSQEGRIFANFPRWRDEIPYSVVEVMPDGNHRPYPNQEWNTFSDKPDSNRFTSVQSVIAQGSSLFVLDPANPEMKGVVGKARLFEFDLATNKLKRRWEFNEKIAPKNSYLNDVRIDEEAQKAFITDSGIGGIVVLDLESGKARRVLDKHASTKAEDIELSIERKLFTMQGKQAEIHSDGIALSPVDGRLYYQALTGYSLYSVPSEILSNPDAERKLLEKSVVKEGATPASDGLIFDKSGNLFMGDLERNAISYRKPSGEMKILIQDERIKFPDTLTIDQQNRLLFTDSKLHLTKMGESVKDLTFEIYRVALPAETSSLREAQEDEQKIDE
jgi:sugar lactone lactonase YvrE